MAEGFALTTAGDSGEFSDPKDRASTFWEGTKASLELGVMSIPTTSLAEIGVKEYVKNDLGSEKLQPSELNEMYPGSTFTSPQTKMAAAFMHEVNSYNRELQNKIENGPSGKMYGLTKFVAQLVPQALDPINYFSGKAIGSVAGRALVGTKIGSALGYDTVASIRGGMSAANSALEQQVAKSALTNEALSLTGFGRHAAEGVMGNLAIEPINIYKANEFGEEYSPTDVALNAVAAGVGFAGISHIGGRIGRFVGKLSGKHLEMVDHVAYAQLANDMKVTPEVLLHDYINETNGSTRQKGPQAKGLPPHEFKPIDPTNPSDRSFYGGTHNSNAALSTESSAVVGGEGYGRGVYFSDDLHKPNGEVSRKMDESPGSVHEVVLHPDTKLLNLNEPIPVELLNKLDEALLSEISATQHTADIFDNVKQQIEEGHLPPEALQTLNDTIKELGFDGIRYEEHSVLGEHQDPHNVVMLFDDSKFETKDIKRANPETVPRIGSQELAALKEKVNAPENHPLYDKEANAYVEEAKNVQEATVSEHLAEMEQRAEEIQKEMSQLNDLGLLSKEDLRVFEEIKAAAEDTKIIDKILEASKDCMGRHG